MGNLGLSREDAEFTVAIWERNDKNITKTAYELCINRASLQSRLRVCSRMGLCGYMPVLDGFAIKQISTSTNPDGSAGKTYVKTAPERGAVFEPLAGHDIKAESALIDADGRLIQKWVKTKEGPSVVNTVEAIKAAFTDYVKPNIEPRPEKCLSDYMTLYPANDWHCGMFSWGKETGENWDIKIATNVIGQAIEDVIARSKPSKYAVILGGGDLMHSDNNKNQTANSSNVLDVDGRYPKILQETCKLVVRAVDAALNHHEHVTVRILPGNHDEHASVAIAYFLLAWYRNESRATIDVDPSLFWWHRFGKVMLGATHGHTVKIDKMPAIMASRRAPDWGLSEFRYIHGFHIHHKTVINEGNGVICESHQAPIPQDAWHFGAGFISGRTIQSITYHKDFGEAGRVVEPILAQPL